MNIKKQIPNLLTFSRLPLTGLVIWLIMEQSYHLAMIALFVGAMTDLGDGFLARKWQAESQFGHLADHVIDRVFLLPVFYLFWRHLPLSIVIIIFGAELVVIFISAMLVQQAASWPNLSGKTAYGLVIAAGVIIMLAAHWPSWPTFRTLTYLCLTGSVIFRVISFRRLNQELSGK